jgi:hypothetical protein
MIVDELRRAARAEPFQPFILQTNDGRSFFVDDSFHIGIAPNGKSVAVALPDGTFDFLHMSAIVRVEVVSPASH